MELPAELYDMVINPGSIIHADKSCHTYIDHDKFFVIIGIYDDTIAGYFFINSGICNTILREKGEQLQMQFPMMKKDYPFLDHDSIISAGEIIKMQKGTIYEYIREGKMKQVANLKEEDLTAIREKARQSKLFKPIEKKRFLY